MCWTGQKLIEKDKQGFFFSREYLAFTSCGTFPSRLGSPQLVSRGTQVIVGPGVTPPTFIEWESHKHDLQEGKPAVISVPFLQ